MIQNLSVYQWPIILFSTVLIGMAKAGIKGVDMINIVLMALVFGSKNSTGIVLPLFCISDIFAILYYKKHIRWQYFWNLTPAIIIGVMLGAYFGQNINEFYFKKLMSTIVILTVILLIWQENKKDFKFPKSPFFGYTIGLICGLASMLGNLAGAFSNVYFLATGLKRKDFIGTAAVVFLVVNLVKLPMQIWAWHNININTLKLDLCLLPSLFVGFMIGIKFINYINEAVFRKTIIVLTIFGSIMILFS